jgi:hypothetical protein
MSQGKFDLDLGLKKHADGLKYGLQTAYNRHRSDLHLDCYKIYFKDVDSQDSITIANAILEAKANVPEGISPEQWPLICDSFEADSWKVNISYSNKLKIIFSKISIQL